MLKTYQLHEAEREALGIPPLPLTASQTAQLCELLKQPPPDVAPDLLLRLLQDRVPPGVDGAAYVKAAFLTAIAKGETTSSLISPLEAVAILGTMLGGYNVESLVSLLQSSQPDLAAAAATSLSRTLLVYDAFHNVQELAQSNVYAQRVLEFWAEATWFTERPPLAEAISVTIFKVPGETNTDDLSPAPHATSRPGTIWTTLSMGGRG